MGGYIGSRAVNLSTTAADVSGNATIGGNLTVSGTTVTIDSANAQTVDLGDNDKIRLGDGDDLQIYHDGSNSYIDDQGTGRVYIRASDQLRLQASDGENYALFAANGAAQFYYDNSQKLATTATGVNVTGGMNITGSGNTDIYLNTGNNSGDNNRLFFGDTADIDVGYVSYDHGTNAMTFGVNAAERVRIDASGNVGIGTSSPQQLLHVSANNPGGKIRLEMGQTGVANNDVTGEIQFYHNDSSGAGVNANIKGICTSSVGAGALTFGTGTTSATERMRLDASGNLLVGKSVQSIATVGVTVVDGQVTATADGADAIRLNRKSSDGSIIDLRKDGTTVGKIVSLSGTTSSIALDPRTSGVNGAGLSGGSLSSTAGVILPTDGSGALEDNTIDLGHTDYRFKDLKLGGGAYLGGTGSANYLSDYEEGTWTPSIVSVGSLSVGKARYVKIGNYVNLSFYVTSINPTANSYVFKIGGLPFTVKTDSSYYVGGSIGYTGDNNLNDVMILTGTALDYVYFHLNDGDGGAITNTEMRNRGYTGASLDAMIASISYTSA